MAFHPKFDGLNQTDIDTISELNAILSDANLIPAEASATDNAIVRWDGTSGEAIQNSGVLIDDSDNVTGIADLTVEGTTTLATSLTGVLRADSGVVSVDTSLDDVVSRNMGTYVVEATTDVATGDGKAYLPPIPSNMNGMNLVAARAAVVTAGTTNATTVMIHNVTQAADMLSGAISIASGGTSGTGTVDTDNDDVATGDVLRVDVDSVSTTAPKGLLVTLEFQTP